MPTPGLFVFTEHVIAAPGTWLAAAQRWVSPLTKSLFHCSVSHNALATIHEEGGWAELDAEQFVLPAAALWGPHLAGVAVKASAAQG